MDRLDVLQAAAATLQSLPLRVLGVQACWGLNSSQVLKLL